MSMRIFAFENEWDIHTSTTNYEKSYYGLDWIRQSSCTKYLHASYDHILGVGKSN